MKSDHLVAFEESSAVKDEPEPLNVPPKRTVHAVESPVAFATVVWQRCRTWLRKGQDCLKAGGRIPTGNIDGTIRDEPDVN